MYLKRFLACTAFTLAASTNAFAGGFQLSEYSTTNLGRGFAGLGIVGDDYSAIAFNPAGMVLKDTGLQLGTSLVMMNANATGNINGVSEAKGKVRVTEIVPHFFAQKKISEDLRIGLGVYVPFGLGTNYNSDWFGRNHALKSEVQAIDVSASISYRIHETLSIGASAIIERASAHLTNGSALGVSDLEADSTRLTWNAGIMYQPLPDTRFGISYRAHTSHKLKGDHELANFSGNCDAKLDLPEHLIFSAHQNFGKFALSASAKWTKWSRFETLDIYSDIFGNKALLQHIDEGWQDTWIFSGGVDYFVNDELTLRAGIAYDEAGVTDAEHRTARVPDNDRIILSFGIGYKYENWQIDASFAHMFMDDSRTNHTIAGNGTLQANYETQINLLALSVQYNF